MIQKEIQQAVTNLKQLYSETEVIIEIDPLKPWNIHFWLPGDAAYKVQELTVSSSTGAQVIPTFVAYCNLLLNKKIQLCENAELIERLKKAIKKPTSAVTPAGAEQ